MCRQGLDAACGAWNPSQRSGSAQLNVANFWQDINAKGKQSVLEERHSSTSLAYLDMHLNYSLSHQRCFSRGPLRNTRGLLLLAPSAHTRELSRSILQTTIHPCGASMPALAQWTATAATGLPSTQPAYWVNILRGLVSFLITKCLKTSGRVVRAMGGRIQDTALHNGRYLWTSHWHSAE